GRAWRGLGRQDFAQAARLRREIGRYDAQSGPQWHGLREDSAALTLGVQQQLQMPARLGLLRAAQHAATAAEEAEQTLRKSAAAVLGLVLLVSLMLAVSISVPVRRLTAATRRLAGGAPGERAGARLNAAAPGAAVRGRGQLQVDQRYARPQLRRSGAAAHRRAPARRHRRYRPAGAPGRRRVHGAARGCAIER